MERLVWNDLQKMSTFSYLQRSYLFLLIIPFGSALITLLLRGNFDVNTIYIFLFMFSFAVIVQLFRFFHQRNLVINLIFDDKKLFIEFKDRRFEAIKIFYGNYDEILNIYYNNHDSFAYKIFRSSSLVILHINSGDPFLSDFSAAALRNRCEIDYSTVK